jgi:glycosyltransferase involved in cell wall biosynthesis
MRVVLLAPWFRTFAHHHGAALEHAGHEVLLVTTDGHPERGGGLVREVVLPARLRHAAAASSWVRARRALRSFRPDVALLDDTWDPRFVPLVAGTPWALVVHDATPHDATHERVGWRRWTAADVRRRAPAFVCLSDSVARRLDDDRPVFRIPLVGEAQEADVPARRHRRDFVALGRLRPYKNLDVVLEAWQEHHRDVAGDDRLLVVGEGALTGPTPAGAVHVPGTFRLADVVPLVASAKGSLCAYREASQSGAQLLSMQVGTMPVASTAGGLPEYQPPALPCIEPDDVAGVASAFRRLADPDEADRLGAAARQHYEAVASPVRLREALDVVVAAVAAGPTASARRGDVAWMSS